MSSGELSLHKRVMPINSAAEPIGLNVTATRWSGAFNEALPLAPIQKALKDLERDPGPIHATYTPSSASYTLARAGALFDAVYKTGVTTDGDAAEIKKLRQEIKSQEKQLKAIPEGESVYEQKCLSTAKKALSQLTSLRTALEASFVIRDKLEFTIGTFMDSALLPLYPGEGLITVGSVTDSLKALLELQAQMKEFPEDSASRIRLQANFNKEVDYLLLHFEKWGDVVVRMMEKEVKELNKSGCDKESLTRQLAALRDQQEHICKELDAATNLLKENKDLGNLSKSIANVLREIQKQHDVLAKQKLEAKPLKYGDEEWRELVMSRPKHEPQAPGLLRQLFNASTWSASTQSIVYGLFTAMQLGQTAIEFSQKVGQAEHLKAQADWMQNHVKEMQKKVSPEQQKKLDRGLAQIGIMLTDKYDVLKNHPEKIAKLVKDPEVIDYLKQAVGRFAGSKPTREQVRHFQDAFEMKQMAANVSSPLAHLTFNDWWTLFTQPEIIEETPPQATAEQGGLMLREQQYEVATSSASRSVPWAASLISTIGTFLFQARSEPAEHSKFIEEKLTESALKVEEAMDTLAEVQLELTQDIPHVKELQGQIQLLQSELIKTSRKEPEATCSLGVLADWAQEVSDKCYAVEQLEKQISNLMAPTKAALALNDAELEKYGKKHANLVRMGRLIEALKIPGVAVPLPQGINTERVTAFLEKHAPEVFEEWDALGQLYNEYKGSEPFLKEAEAIDKMNRITTGISKAFADAAHDDALFKQLATQEVSDWLDAIRANGDYLMVRSTGSEDSRATANAGGNISEAYVSPSREAFCEAAAKVIGSYFSFSSLQNRINAGLNPFEEDLKLAVTAQQLIGEPVGGAKRSSEIPVSGVLFTSEPIFGDFRVMRISTTYGHGEGVVSGEGIASDTALLLISEAHPDQIYIQYSNMDKPFRLAPVQTPEGVKLMPVANPSELQQRTSLDTELITRLYTVGIVMEKYFDGVPTDMELVIKSGVINIVQARPVNRPEMLPTYLSLSEELMASLEKIEADVIVPGLGSVIKNTKAEELDFTATLKEAEEAFRTNMHKMVVVTQPEPANSHPVVNFSGLGVTCLLVLAGNKEKLQELLKKASPETPLVVDSQTGTIYLWDSKNGNLDEHIKKGFAVHPAKIVLSLPVRETLKSQKATPEVPYEVKKLLVEIRSAVTDQAAKGKLDELRSHKFVTSLKEQKQMLEEHAFVPKRVAQTKAALNALIEEVDKAFNEVEAILTNPIPTEQEKMRTLYLIKTLETILVSNPSRGDSIAQYSRLTFEAPYLDALELVEYQKGFTHPVHFADIYLASDAAVDDTSKGDWREFLKNLEPDVQSGAIIPAKVRQLQKMVNLLDKTGMLTNWFAFYFKYDPSVEPAALLDQVLSTFPTSDEGKIETILSLGSSVQAVKNNIDAFSNQKSFPAAWQKLQALTQTLTALSGPNSIKEMMDNASPVTRMMVLSTMQEMVDTYDSAIKAMKSDTGLDPEVKVALFGGMLVSYFSMLNSWATQLTPSLTLPLHREYPIDQYMRTMRGAFSSFSNDLIQLQPSNGFSVVHSVLGAATAFNRGLPRTMEDYFTLTHQNLIAIISNVRERTLRADERSQASLPSSFKKALETINEDTLGRPAQITGFEVTATGIAVKYNIPLQNHSAQMILRYDKETKKTIIEGFLLGQARERWGESALIATLLDACDNLPMDSPLKLSGLELNLRWQVKEEGTQPILQVFNLFCEHSMNGNLDVLASNIERLFPGFKDRMPESIDSIMKTGNTDLIIKAMDLLKTYNFETDHMFVLSILEKVISYPDPGVQESSILFVRDLLYKNINRLNQLADKGNFYERLFKILEKGSDSSNILIRIESLKVVTNLVSSGFGIETASKIGEGRISDRSWYVREEAYKLITAIIDKGYPTEKAHAIIDVGLNDNYFSGSVIALMHKIVEKEPSLSESTQQQTLRIVAQAWDQEDPSVKFKATELMISVINRDVGIGESTLQQALRVVAKAWDQNDPSINNQVSQLLEKLTDKGFGLDRILDIVEEFTDEDRQVPAFVYEKIIAIADRINPDKVNRCYDLAKKGVEQAASRDNYSYAIPLLRLLVARDRAVELGIKMAQQGLEQPEKDIRAKALDLFLAMVIRRHGINEALKAAEKGLRDDALREAAKNLIKHSHVMQSVAVVEVVENALNDPNASVRLAALDILTTFFQKEPSFATQAVNAAVKGIGDPSLVVQKGAIKLFAELIKNNQGIQEAKDIAAAHMESDLELSSLLYNILIRSGQDVGKEAIIAAEKGMAKDLSWEAFQLLSALLNTNYKSRDLAVILEKVIKKSDASDTSITIAWGFLTKFIAQEGDGVDIAVNLLKTQGIPSNEALGLLKQLVVSGRGQDVLEILEVALPSGKIQSDIRPVYIEFTMQGQMDQVIKLGEIIITNGAKSVDLDLVYNFLIEKGYLQETFNAATKALEGPSRSGYNAILLVQKLQEKGFAPDQVVQLLLKTQSSENIFTRLEVLNMFEKLVQQGLYLKEAAEAVENGKKDPHQYIRETALKLETLLQKKN